MMNINTILVVTASLASVSHAVPFITECILEVGNTAGVAGNSEDTAFDERSIADTLDTDLVPVLAQVCTDNAG